MEELAQTITEAYAAAAAAKDVDAFVALYDESVRVFDMWGAWAVEGRDAWRAGVEEWFGSLGEESIRVEFAEVEAAAGDELAVVHAFVTFHGLSAAGEELRSMSNRVTWALRRAGHGWLIVHEHTSAPLDDEARAIFRR